MGPSEGCLQLEELVKQVVSPFLGVSEDRGVSGPTYTLGKGHHSLAARALMVMLPATEMCRDCCFGCSLCKRVHVHPHSSPLACVLVTCSPLWDSPRKPPLCLSGPHL